VLPPIFTNSSHYLPPSVRLIQIFNERYCRCCNECPSRRNLLANLLSVRSSKVIFKRGHLPHFHQQRLSI